MSGWNESAWLIFSMSVALKGTAVLGAAWLMAFLLRRRSAAERHLVWSAAAVALLVMPLLSMALPGLRISVPARFLISSAQATFRTTAVADAASDSAAASRAAGAPSGKPVAGRFDWRIALMLLWAAVSGVALGRMALAYAGMWRTRRSAQPFSDHGLCEYLSRELGIRRRVDVLETRRGSMPMNAGVLRSAILLPSEAADWSEERLRVVLLHELAHARRGDVLAHWIASAALALYWWNPLAWKAWRGFLKESERATDDLVLTVAHLKFGERPSDYAGHLLAVARSMQVAPAIEWTAVAMARRSQLEDRVTAILDSRIERRVPGPAWAITAAIAAIAIAGPLAAVRAQDNTQSVPADVDAAIRSAQSQKNYEILENAAKAAEQQHKYDIAQQLLEPAVALRAENNGQQSVEYGIGLLKLGDLESKRNQNKSAEDFYSRAAQILGDRPEAARALMFLGKEAIRRKDFSQAAEYLERAQHNDPQQAGAASMWLAIVRSNEGNAGEAEVLFKTALGLEDPNSTGAVTTLQVYARFLRKQGREDEAKEMEARATATQKAIAAKPAFDSTVYKIGPGISAPAPLTKIEPQYSEDARVAQLQGAVLLSLEIGADGLAHNIQVVRGLGLGLDEKAVDAVQQWTFKPGTKDGQPVPVVATIEVNFRLL